MSEAAEQIADLLIDHGFDTDEVADLLSQIYSGFLAEASQIRGGADYIFSECSRAAKSGIEELLEMSKNNKNG